MGSIDATSTNLVIRQVWSMVPLDLGNIEESA